MRAAGPSAGLVDVKVVSFSDDAERAEDGGPARAAPGSTVASPRTIRRCRHASGSRASGSWAAAWPATTSRRASRSRSGTARPSSAAPLAAAGAAGGAHAARAGGALATWWSPASPTRTRWSGIVFAEDGVLAAARPGFRYLETSTISPGLARRVAEALRSKGARHAGGAGHRLEDGRGEGHADPDDRRPARAPRRADAGDDGRSGPRPSTAARSGQASVVKLIGNTLISFMLEGLCEGLVVARKAGLPIETMLEVIMASGYAVALLHVQGRRHRAARLGHALLDRPAGQGPGPDARRGAAARRAHARPGRDPRGLPGGAGPGLRRRRTSRRW